MGEKEVVTVQVPTSMREEIDDYADNNTQSRSQALRTLIESGLERERGMDWMLIEALVSVTAIVASLILFFGAIISWVAVIAGYALGVSPLFLFGMAFGGLVIAALSQKVTQWARWVDSTLATLSGKITGDSR